MDCPVHKTPMEMHLWKPSGQWIYFCQKCYDTYWKEYHRRHKVSKMVRERDKNKRRTNHHQSVQRT